MLEVARNYIATRRYSLYTLRVSRLDHLTRVCVNSSNRYVRWHDYAHPEERQNGTQKNSQAIGLQNNEATVRWLYDNHFAAVAGDTVAFEAWPPPMETGKDFVMIDSVSYTLLT
jgi:succinylglutamate desuccinylase